jgi:predicted N-acetyltransferase YhbS
VHIRLMTDDDVDACEQLWHGAFSEMRARFGLPTRPRTEDGAAADRARIRHLLTTDPTGSFVADDGSRVVGLAQALRRGDLWILSLFGVLVGSQQRGLGKALLDASLAYMQPGDRGWIVCSRDPRAMRRYALAGFDLHPAITAWGKVVPDHLPPAPDVRDGTDADLELAAALDEKVRGASHGPDFEPLRDEATAFFVVDGRGYAFVRNGWPRLLVATDDDAAAQLLSAALRSARPDDVVEVGWLTGAQQWAFPVVLAAGLELYPVGPVMLRGFDAMPSPYVPVGAYG